MVLGKFMRGKKRRELEEKVLFLENKLKNTDLILQRIYERSIEESEEFQDTTCLASAIALKKKMLVYELEEKERKWTQDGLVNFAHLIRTQVDNKELLQLILSALVKYLEANQGGLFLLNKSSEEPYLELIASYAYGRKRQTEKIVQLGEGILGQCFLDGKTTFWTDLPPSYTDITSGLGEATPSCLLMVPLVFNGKVLGVLELASFTKFISNHLLFVEKIAESIAAVYYSVQNKELSDKMLYESELREQMLREQEEELRQNLEELVTTQEEMSRKQVELDQKGTLLKLIIDQIPFPVFVKDNNGCYTLVNKAEAALFALEEEAILGKDDRYFVTNKEEWEIIKASDAKTLSSDKTIELPEQSFTTSEGKTHIFKTSKVPFLNSVTGEKNILGVSLDLTELIALRKKVDEISYTK